jgi:hypothetical protein
MLLSGWKPLGGTLFEGILDPAFLAHVEQTSTETFTSVLTGQCASPHHGLVEGRT